MKPIITFSAVVLLALGMSVTSAEAKGQKKAPSTNTVDGYLKAHDHNKNGSIEPTEYPGARAEFDKWDTNKDGKLDRSELSAMLSKK